MEWMNRNGRPNQGPGQTVTPSTTTAAHVTNPGGAHHSSDGNKRRKAKTLSFANITTVVMLFSLTLIALGVIGFLMTARQNDESQYVAEDKMQAVFLNGGQVYFGKIRELNGKYIGMNDIYYLRVNQQVQPKQGAASQQDISLVKLGCELHGPQDHMIINREQVVFWENLKTDGQVAKAVEEYKKANPNGQNCDTANSQNGQSNNADANNAQEEEPAEETTPAAETPAPTTPTTPTTGN
jgi:hypothetical protein